MNLDYEKATPTWSTCFLCIYKSLLPLSFLFGGLQRFMPAAKYQIKTFFFPSIDHAQTSVRSLTFRVGVIDILHIVA